MVDCRNSLETSSGTTAEQRIAPWRKLERKVEMLLDGVDAEPEHSNFQKRRIGKSDPCFAKKRADAEFDLVGAADDAGASGDRMLEMTVRATSAICDDRGVGLQSAQPDGKLCRRDASRDIDGVNGNASGLAALGLVCHPAALSRSAGADSPTKPVMHRASVQRQIAHGAEKEV